MPERVKLEALYQLTRVDFRTDRVGARFQAEYRGVEFVVESSCPTAAVAADPQLLASGITNILNNAFDSAPSGSRVVMKGAQDRFAPLIEVEDKRDDLPMGGDDLFERSGRGAD